MRFLELLCRYLVRVAEISCIYRELKTDNILLQFSEKQIIKVSDLHSLIYKRLQLSVIRTDTEIYVETLTVSIASYLIDRVIWFCDAQLKSLYLSIQFDTRKLYNCIWISAILSASPADIYCLPTLHFITRINNKVTNNLESLLKVIALMSKNQYCQVICISRKDILTTISIRLNLRDFKIIEFWKKIDCQSWQYREL